MINRMSVVIGYHSEFAKQLKTLAKKYHSLRSDYQKFLGDLEQNPYMGTDLGNGVRKVRMAITSKGKGKSGGARVITYVVQAIDQRHILVTLLTIYDKNEIENVSDRYIKSLLASL